MDIAPCTKQRCWHGTISVIHTYTFGANIFTYSHINLPTRWHITLHSSWRMFLCISKYSMTGYVCICVCGWVRQPLSIYICIILYVSLYLSLYIYVYVYQCITYTFGVNIFTYSHVNLPTVWHMNWHSSWCMVSCISQYSIRICMCLCLWLSQATYRRYLYNLYIYMYMYIYTNVYQHIHIYHVFWGSKIQS